MKFRINRGALLGTLVAFTGSAIAISTAFALYTKYPTDQSIHISAHTDDDIVLNVGTITNDNQANLQPGTSRTFDFTLGATKTAASTYNQNVFIANLNVTVSSENATLLSAIKQNSSIALDTGDNNYYGSYWKGQSPDFNTPPISEGSFTVTQYLPIPVDDTGTLQLTANLSLGEMSETDFIGLDEATYNVNISLTAPGEEFEYAYIVGNFNGWTSGNDIYQMVIDPQATYYAWMYTFTEGTVSPGDEFKANMHTDEDLDSNPDTEDYIWSAGDDTIADGNPIGDTYRWDRATVGSLYGDAANESNNA